MAETIPDHLKPHTSTIADMILAGCGDASHAVGAAAINAAAIYVSYIGDEPEVMVFSKVVLPMLEVIQRCIKNGDEEIAREGLEVFTDCVEMEQPLINDHLTSILPFVVGILKENDCAFSLKQSAGQVLLSIIEYRPKLVANLNMVTPILQSLIEIIAVNQSEHTGGLYAFDKTGGDDEEDNEFDEDVELQQLCQMCVDRMAQSIPSKYFVEPALAFCAQVYGHGIW